MRVARPVKPRIEPGAGPRRRVAAGLVLAILIAGVGLVVWWVSREGVLRDPETLWRQAVAEVEARDWDRATADLDRLARLRPPSARDWRLRARLALDRGRSAEALAALGRIDDSGPIGADARFRAGRIELRRHRARFAEDQLRRALALDPGLIQAHRELIYLYGMQQRRAELDGEFRALSRLTPLGFGDVFLWSLSQGAGWEPIEVTETLARFVDADPEDRRSRLTLIDFDRRRGRLDQAARLLGPLPESDPDARAQRVELCLARGDEAAARALLDAGPDDHAGLQQLRGRLALTRRDGPAAVRHFRAAIRLEPDSREALFGLGNALQLVGETRESGRLLARARRRDVLTGLIQRAATPDGRADRTLPIELGRACAAIGRRDEARAWFKLAIARDPLDAEAQRALFRLDAPGRGGPAQ